ncbi:DUF397 domain-containing protein [Saccharopolyspora phatthalungensis]|uniref:DUF397 domain-containing protein n=1 Tax=Saccharopolyspora phatthalungensis TaxID=664693 RepID=A0A840QKT0_9PSEU|nr:DUF397 domain-containing protein [Saccharopolyspora phatthalungensis]MBB5159313.1 hypothetical protein [Saccharopolyspora phatthalungensis]
MTAERCATRAAEPRPSTPGRTGNGDAGSNCVEVAPLHDGRIAVRNSKHPEAGVVFFTLAEMDAWIKGCEVGEFDDLADTGR